MSDKGRGVASPSQTVGPFFHFALATNERLGRIASAEARETIRLRVRVLDGGGVPVPDALVEIYQADERGGYPQGPQDGHSTFTGFGRLPTDADGFCVFETVRAGRVAGIRGVQAPHVTVCLFARGLLRQLYTRIYFAGDAGLDEDPILTLVPAERRDTLLAVKAADTENVWDFVIRLQGDGETVFFDL